jgi:hypothetical protein
MDLHALNNSINSHTIVIWEGIQQVVGMVQCLIFYIVEIRSFRKEHKKSVSTHTRPKTNQGTVVNK